MKLQLLTYLPTYLSSTARTITQTAFHPNPDMDVVTVVGNGVFRSFKIVEGNMKAQANALGKREAQNYTCQAWATDGEKERLLVGTDSGEVLVVEGGELKGSIAVGDGQAVESILPFSKGFLLGSSGGGLSVFEKQDVEKARLSSRPLFPCCIMLHFASHFLSPRKRYK